MSDPFTRDYSSGAGFRRMFYNVNGFWSINKISVVQSKDWSGQEWCSVQISWSSGGRSVEVDEITAAESFIAALQDAVGVARLWEIERNQTK